jgi:hypothetical protein
MCLFKSHTLNPVIYKSIYSLFGKILMIAVTKNVI